MPKPADLSVTGLRRRHALTHARTLSRRIPARFWRGRCRSAPRRRCSVVRASNACALMCASTSRGLSPAGRVAMSQRRSRARATSADHHRLGVARRGHAGSAAAPHWRWRALLRASGDYERETVGHVLQLVSRPVNRGTPRAWFYRRAFSRCRPSVPRTSWFSLLGSRLPPPQDWATPALRAPD
jgi:hypothetical protein